MRFEDHDRQKGAQWQWTCSWPSFGLLVSYLIRRERDRPTFTIIAPQQVAMRVTERRKEGLLSFKGLIMGGFSSDTWAMTLAGGGVGCGKGERERGRTRFGALSAN